MSDWGGADFEILVDSSTGSYPLPTYASYGSTRHVPTSNIDIVQYTGTGAGTLVYNVIMTLAEYDKMVGYYRTIPRAYHTLTVLGVSMSYWYLDTIESPVLMLDGRVMCTITLHEHT